MLIFLSKFFESVGMKYNLKLTLFRFWIDFRSYDGLCPGFGLRLSFGKKRQSVGFPLPRELLGLRTLMKPLVELLVCASFGGTRWQGVLGCGRCGRTDPLGESACGLEIVILEGNSNENYWSFWLPRWQYVGDDP